MGEKIMENKIPLEIDVDLKQNTIDKVANTQRERTSNLLGLIGMVFIQGATLPSLVNVVWFNGTPPPLTLLVGVFVGLLFYQARALRNLRYEWVYAIGNTIGLTSNFILILYSL
jgi:hypothetical protein